MADLTNETNYFVMGYDVYYPSGGFNDCKGIYGNLEEAVSRAGFLNPKYDHIGARSGYDNVEIWTITGNVPTLVKQWEDGMETNIESDQRVKDDQSNN